MNSNMLENDPDKIVATENAQSDHSVKFGNPDYYHIQGRLYADAGNYGEAQIYFTQAIDLCFEILEDAYRWRATSYEWLDKGQEALNDYNWLVEHGYADSSIYEQRGSLKAQQKRYLDAIGDFTIAYHMRPHMLTLAKRAQSYVKAKLYKEAIRDFSTIIEGNDPYPGLTANALYSRGLANLAAGNYQEALTDLRQFVSSEENYSAKIYYYIGLVYQKMGMMEEALENFRQSDIDHDHPDAQHVKELLDSEDEGL
ncbi:MAG: tetratricopeptide repeat protein [Chitinophagaceae bacterium]|nr:tetratricopeptide repeat protein [Anaerolineae bacterium]